jgi:predicted transcriptional regulator
MRKLFALRIDEDLLSKLEDVARRRRHNYGINVSKSDLVREAVEHFISREEKKCNASEKAK